MESTLCTWMSLLPAKRKILRLLLRDLTPIRIGINVKNRTLLRFVIHLPSGSPSCSPHAFQWRRDIHCGHLKMQCLRWTWLWPYLGPLILEIPPWVTQPSVNPFNSKRNVWVTVFKIQLIYNFVKPFNFNIKLLKFSVFKIGTAGNGTFCFGLN